MYRGGGTLDEQSGGEILSRPAAGSKLPPGAEVDLRTVPVIDGPPFTYNASVAKKDLVPYSAQQSINTSNTITFDLPANSTPGLMYSFSESSFEFPFTWAWDSGNWTHDNVPRNGFADLIWDRIELSINGVPVDDEQSNLYPFLAFVRRVLNQPARGSFLISTDRDGGSSGQWGPSRPSADAILVDEWTGAPGDMFVSGMDCTTWRHMIEQFLLPGGTGTTNIYTKAKQKLRLRPQHPVFKQEMFLPANAHYRISFTKSSRGAANYGGASYAWYNYGTTTSVGLGTDRYPPVITFQEPTFYLQTVQLSTVGLSWVAAAKQAAMGAYTYRTQRYAINQYQLAAGSTNFTHTIMVARRPQALVIHMIPTTNLSVLDALTANLLNMHPYCSYSITTEEGHRCAVKEIYARIGGEQYPKNYRITRESDGNLLAVGGSSARDYDVYKELTTVGKDGDPSAQPYLSRHNMEDAFTMYFINLADNGSTIQDFHKPALTGSAQIELHMELYAVAPVNTTVFVTSVENATFSIDGTRCKTSW